MFNHKIFVGSLFVGLFVLIWSFQVFAQEKEERDSLHVKYQKPGTTMEISTTDADAIKSYMDMSLEELLNVDVKITSASKFEESLTKTPATILVISKEDIKNRGYTSLHEVLADLPGFDISASYGNMTQLVYARGNRTGSYTERTMLMINGIEHNILYAQNMNISHDFPLTAIERIEVLYGPASAVYGPNAFSGIINIITKSSNELKNNSDAIYTNAGGGSFNTQFGEMTYLAMYGKIGLSLSYRRFKSDMFDMTDKPGYFDGDKLFGNEEVWGPYAKYYPEFDNAVNDYAILSRLRFKNLEVGFNKLQTRHGNGSEYPYDKTLPTTDWKFFREKYYLKYNNDVTDRLNWTFLATYQKSGAGPDAVWAQGWNSDDSWESQRTVELLTWKFISYKWSFFEDLVYKLNNNFVLSGGLKYASGNYQKSYEFGYSDQITFTPGESSYFVGGVEVPEDELTLFPHPHSDERMPGNNFDDSEWGAYLQAKFTSTDEKLNLVAGARYDDNDIYGDSFNPRIGATYQLMDKLLMKTNYGTAFQAPAPRNLYGGWGGLEVSENLAPEEIQTIDVSLLSTSSCFSNDVTFFYNQVTESIMQGENLPDKNMYGVEYKFNFVLKNLGENIKNVRTHFNYTYTDAKYDAERTSDATGRASDNVGDIAQHKANLIFDADLFQRLHWNMRFNYVGEKETTISNPIETVDPYLITDLSVQLKHLFDKDISLFFTVNNLFDEEYFHPGVDNAGGGEDLSTPSDSWYSSRLPQPERNFMVGLRTKF